MGLIGSAVSAAGSLAGGSYAAQAGAMQQQAANYTAAQLEENAPGAIGAAQRKMLDDRNKAQQAESTLRARGGASGVDIGSGSPVQVGQSVAGRGEYQALMDLWQGKNQATGMLNEAKAVRYGGDIAAYSGDAQKTLSEFNAAGTLAGGIGSGFKTYGALTYPSTYGMTPLGAGF